MTHQSFFRLLGRLGFAGILLLLSYYGLGALAGLAMVVLYGIFWFRAGRNQTALLRYALNLVVGLAVVLLLNLTIPPLGLPLLPAPTKLLVALLYGLWLGRERRGLGLADAALAHVVGLAAIFLAVAYWHWIEIAAVALCWVVAYVVTRSYLEGNGERAATILAAAWALIVTEVSWVLFGWQVLYDVGSSGYLIVPQIVIIVIGLGYCFSSIYATHQQKKLSRSRLIEYVTVAGVLLAIIIAGTKWDTTI